MFSVDEPTAEAIRRAYEEGGELAGVVELRLHFPLLGNDENARHCVRMIAGWKPIGSPPATEGRQKGARRRPRQT